MKCWRSARAVRPPLETLDQVPQLVADRVAAGTLVQDGKVFYEMGKYDQAEIKLSQAIRMDPGNTTASYYLNLIQQDKIHRDSIDHNTDTQKRMEHVEKQWILPQNASARNHISSDTVSSFNGGYATNSIVWTGPGRQAIMQKLDKIHFEKTDDFSQGLPLTEVLKQLNEQCRLHDSERKGVNFLINNNSDKSGTPRPWVPGVSVGGAGPGAAAPGASAIAANRGFGATGALDPNTGLPLAPSAETTTTEQPDVGSYLIKLPTLSDVRLADLLDAIVLVADHPIKYSIEDFAVVFSQKNPEGQHLLMRTYRVDPNTFYSGLEGVSAIAPFGAVQNGSTTGGTGGTGGGGGGGGGSGNNQGVSAVIGVVNAFAGGGQARATTGGGASQAGTTGAAGAGGTAGGTAQAPTDPWNEEGLPGVSVRSHSATYSYLAAQFFGALGISWSDPPGKALFFNDRLGYLFVRSTESDLDLIERAIQVMDQVPPQVHIKARFIEVSQNDNAALGFNWYLGQFSLGNQAVGQGGTAPSLTVPVSAANPLGAFPGNTAANLVSGQASDQLLTSGLRNTAPTLATFTGILTDPNFRVTLQALQQRQGTENLGEPEITTISGRQTEMKATTIHNIVTSFTTETPNTGVGNVNAATTTSTILQAPPTAVVPIATPLETGPILDVVPYVLADGYTINLALMPSDTEFVQYETIPANAIPGYTPGVSVSGINAYTIPVPLPEFTVRQLVSTVNVWDNQTVALGGLITSQVQSINDSVPVLGDIPLVGRLFQSKSKSTVKDNLMIFVTSTIVDPAGSRVHSDDELPFALTGVPVQPAENVPPTVSEKTVLGLPDVSK